MDLHVTLQFLNAQAKRNGRSIGACARCVREALAAGGVVIDPHPISAKDYGPYLEHAGFCAVDGAGYVPHAGDIIVLQSYSSEHPHGHIAMFDGQRWVSDFVQRDMWAGPGYRAARPPHRIYRA